MFGCICYTIIDTLYLLTLNSTNASSILATTVMKIVRSVTLILLSAGVASNSTVIVSNGNSHLLSADNVTGTILSAR